MNKRTENLATMAIQTVSIILVGIALTYAGMYAIDKEAEADELAAKIERQRHANECNAMVGAHRRECLKEVEVVE